MTWSVVSRLEDSLQRSRAPQDPFAAPRSAPGNGTDQSARQTRDAREAPATPVPDQSPRPPRFWDRFRREPDRLGAPPARMRSVLSVTPGEEDILVDAVHRLSKRYDGIEIIVDTSDPRHLLASAELSLLQEMGAGVGLDVQLHPLRAQSSASLAAPRPRILTLVVAGHALEAPDTRAGIDARARGGDTALIHLGASDHASGLLPTKATVRPDGDVIPRGAQDAIAATIVPGGALTEGGLVSSLAALSQHSEGPAWRLLSSPPAAAPAATDPTEAAAVKALLDGLDANATYAIRTLATRFGAQSPADILATLFDPPGGPAEPGHRDRSRREWCELSARVLGAPIWRTDEDGQLWLRPEVREQLMEHVTIDGFWTSLAQQSKALRRSFDLGNGPASSWRRPARDGDSPELRSLLAWVDAVPPRSPIHTENEQSIGTRRR